MDFSAFKPDRLKEVSDVLTELAKELKAKGDDRYKACSRASGMLQAAAALINITTTVSGLSKKLKIE